ncbi:MAG: 50S ribosomal protein L22 [Chlamydiia bacterium]|nr:50S ribosomal protein L22 [Chlamydiia bacterium]
MEQSKATTKYIRVPPRKARLVADLIRGKLVDEATTLLTYCKMKSREPMKKTLKSAIANAEVQFDARRDLLRIVEVRVDEGPYFKRAKPKNKGGRAPILKRTSHFTVVVEES